MNGALDLSWYRTRKVTSKIIFIRLSSYVLTRQKKEAPKTKKVCRHELLYCSSKIDRSCLANDTASNAFSCNKCCRLNPRRLKVDLSRMSTCASLHRLFPNKNRLNAPFTAFEAGNIFFKKWMSVIWKFPGYIANNFNKKTSMLYLWIGIVLFLVIYFWNKRRTEGKVYGKQLPGPSALESIRIFSKGIRNNKLHLCLTELAKKYGHIMQVNLLVKNTIFVNDADTFRRIVKDAAYRNFTNDRPPTFVAKQYYHGDKDLSFANMGYEFQQKRKIFHSVLKYFGEGKRQFEKLMTDLLEDTIQTFKFQDKDTLEISESFKLLTARILCCVFTGNKSELTEERVNAIVEFSNGFDNIFVFTVDTTLQIFPFLYLVPGLKYRKLHNHMVTATKNLRAAVFEPKKKTFDPNEKRGLVDEMLAIQKELQERGEKFQLDDESIIAMLHDFTSGGYLTTSATLSILFLFLIKYQHVQARIYEEIEKVTGSSTPSFDNKQSMPYTEAAILETLRISSIVPLQIPHFVNKDLTFDGYHIPKSSILSMNSWFNHLNEEFWEEPVTFKPERFLDASGQLLALDHPVRQKLIPFGSGPRSCPGESFGKGRTFLITVYLLKYFQFVPDENSILPSENPNFWRGNLVLCPQNYTCQIIPRPA